MEILLWLLVYLNMWIIYSIKSIFNFSFTASCNGNIEMVNEFLKNGLNVNEKDKYGETPLMNGLYILVNLKLLI